MSKKIDASQLRNLIMEVLAEEDKNEAKVEEASHDEADHKDELDEADADEGEHKDEADHKEEGDMNESATLNRWRKLAGILKD